MSCKLLSFIGTTSYIESYYAYNNKSSEKPYQFIQEALVEFFCKEWKDDNELIIFMTEESKRKNWLSKSECEDANFDKGLRDRLEKVKKRFKLKLDVRNVEIPEGKSEEELWIIFEKMNESLNDEDVIIFDITHSFRSLPMLSLVVLNYVKFLKNVKIERIVYGAMEALGSPKEVREMPIEERIIPIFDLTPFASLFDWTIAIERFLQTGNAEMMRKLGIEELKPLLAETKGEIGGGLRELITSLDKFSQNVLTCRSPESKSTIERILNAIPKAEKELEKLKPFKPLFGKIKERFSCMQINDVSFGIEIATWCLEKGLIQQGFTILRETIINYVITNILKCNNLQKKTYREIAEVMLNNKYEEIPPEVLNLWHEIVDYRNDINHAGWREQNYHSSTDFERKLKEFIERGRVLVERNND